MNKEELKAELNNLFQFEEERFMEALNEIFTEEWLKDQKEELLMVNTFDSDWATSLKNKIAQDIGEKYTQISSKLSLLLASFIQTEIIYNGTKYSKITELKNDSKILDGLKLAVKTLDKDYGENW